MSISYITENESLLELHHYVLNATNNTSWFNFRVKKLKTYSDKYGDNFCMIINGDKTFNYSYILPFNQFKDFFSSDYIQTNKKVSSRWSGYILGDRLYLSLKGIPRKSISIGSYFNAFHLLFPESIPIENIPFQQDIVVAKHDKLKLSDLSELIRAFNREYESTAPEKKINFSNRIDRPHAITDYLKMLHQYTCQICKTNGFKKRDGSFYIEAHHIIELHELVPGSFCSDNIVVVCPTCHKKLHFADVFYKSVDNNIVSLIINGDTFTFTRNIISQ